MYHYIGHSLQLVIFVILIFAIVISLLTNVEAQVISKYSSCGFEISKVNSPRFISTYTGCSFSCVQVGLL